MISHRGVDIERRRVTSFFEETRNQLHRRRSAGKRRKKKTERDRERERRVGRCVEWQLEREKLNGGFRSASIPRGKLPFTAKLFTAVLSPFFIGRNFVFHSGWRLRTDVNFRRWLSSAFPALYDYRNHLLPPPCFKASI